jgi:hypothetical protein
MRRRILIWHIHGSYLAAITQADHDWFLPVLDGSYGGRRPDLPPYVREVPWDEVRDLDLDLIIYQSPRNLFIDGPAILCPVQRRLPRIYLEHNVPRRSALGTRHPFHDRHGLLVHVTHYNRLMWDSGETPATVIEHSVAIDPSITATRELARGAVVCNELVRRGRAVGLDLFLRARQEVPLDLMGIASDRLGGIGDIKYAELPHRLAAYRFLFSPMRHTSLPLAVIEAMTVGLPIVALATTELPNVIVNGETGYISTDPDELTDQMRALLGDPALARRLGANARELARTRFGLDRFVADWNEAIERAIALGNGDAQI